MDRKSTSQSGSAAAAPQGAAAPRRRRRSRWALNLRLLLATAIIVGVLTPAAIVWRNRQVRFNAEAFLSRAHQLEQEGEHGDAASWVYRYLQLQPQDAGARVELAELFDRSALTASSKRRAATLYFQALGYSPERSDLRERLAELLLELQDFSEAQLEAEKLLRADADHAGALRIRALAMFAQMAPSGRIPVADVARAHVAAQAKPANRADIQLATALAVLYREKVSAADLRLLAEEQFIPASPSAALADQTMQAMVDAQENQGEAYLALHLYRVRYALPAADEALQRALAASPDNVEIMLAAAAAAQRAETFDDSLRWAESAVLAAPQDPRGYIAQGQAARSLGREDEAIAAWRAGLVATRPDDVQLNFLLAEALLASGQTTEAETVLATLSGAVERLTASLPAPSRGRVTESLDLLQADLHVRQGDYVHALPLLKRATISLAKDDDVARDGATKSDRWLRLAVAYERLNMWDLVADAYEHAMAAVPIRSVSTQLAAATAWERAGRLQMAIRLYREAMEMPDAPAAGWTSLARCELQLQIRKSGERDWSQFHSALAMARDAQPESGDVALVEVQGLAAQGKATEALRLLDSIAPDLPQSLGTTILLFEALEASERADEMLERLRGEPNAGIAPLMVESELLVRRGQVDQAATLLEEAAPSASAEDRHTIEHRLASILLSQDDTDAVRERLRNLVQEFPTDLWAWQQLAEVAVRVDDFDEVRRCEDQLRKLEGDSGTLWRFFRALRLVLQAQSTEEPTFHEAQRLQEELQSLRPSWPPTFVLRGRIAHYLGSVEDAADSYRRAIELGASSVTVFEWLVTLLYDNNRWAEADQYLARLQDVVHLSPRLSALAPQLLIQSGKLHRAIAAARAGVERRPIDPLSRIWLGQTLMVGVEQSTDEAERVALQREAEAAFDEAVRLAPENFRTWAALLWYSIKSRQPELAQTALGGLRDRARLTDVERALALAQGHQLIGDLPEAERYFTQAAAADPQNPAVQDRVARFYLNTNPEKAEVAYRRLLELAPDNRAARRTLAALLASSSDDNRFQEGLRLLDGGENEVVDNRLRAILLMQRGGDEQLAEARRLLEGILGEGVAVSPSDRLLLARVYEALSATNEAHAQLKELVAGDRPTGAYVAVYVDFLLRRELLDDAETWLARLETQEPTLLRTARLKVRYLLAKESPPAAIQTEIDRFRGLALEAAQEEGARRAVRIGVAKLFAGANLPEAAEAEFRQLVETSPSVEGCGAYCMWLIETNRFRDAVGVCTTFMERNGPSVELGSLLANVLIYAAGKTGESIPEAEDVLMGVAREFPRNSRLTFDLATLRFMQSRETEALDLYQQVLQLAPKNVAAMNNIALLMAEHPERADEALLWIDRAIGIGGGSAELRDSKAMVLLSVGQPDKARELLNDIIEETGGNSRYLLHLAAASQMTGELDEAAAAFQEASAGNVGSELLTPAERDLLQRLETELPQQDENVPSVAPQTPK